jgi:RNA polymerase sigma factor (sigma-70 family)
MLTALYEQHSAAAFRYALHLTGRREDAEDVVQHVFVQAYAALVSGTELVNPRAWLMKAAKHRSLNVIRDRRDVPVEDLELEARPVGGTEAEEAEALAAVRALLWTLPEAQHHAFVLRHWSGLSQSEIADVLATTTSAVESLLVRARATLVEEHADETRECREVRSRMIEARPLRGTDASHVSGCRRCRVAQLRLRRVSEFAAALVLIPRPHVGHALASTIPGFGGTTATAGSVAVGTGGTVATSAPAAVKVTVAAKALAVALTASVAVGAIPPLRQSFVSAVAGHHAPGHSADRRSAAHRSTGNRQFTVVPRGGAGTHGHASSTARGNGKSQAASVRRGAKGGSGAGGNGKAKGASNAGGNGKAKGASNAGGNGKAKGASNAGGNGKPKGASNAGGNGKPKATSSGGGNGKAKATSSGGGNGKGKGKS